MCQSVERAFVGRPEKRQKDGDCRILRDGLVTGFAHLMVLGSAIATLAVTAPKGGANINYSVGSLAANMLL